MPAKQQAPRPMIPRKTPTMLLAEIALAQASRRASEPVSKVGTAQNAKGEWRHSIEIAHVDAFEAARIALAVREIMTAADPEDVPF